MPDLGETDYTGPLTYPRLRELGIPDEEVTAFEEREREEAAELAAARPEAMRALQRLDLDPDDRDAVKAAFTELRQRYVDTILGRVKGDGVSGADYYDVVDAIRAVYGFVHWPFDWPPPHVAFMSRPLRNLIPRVKPTATT